MMVCWQVAHLGGFASLANSLTQMAGQSRYDSHFLSPLFTGCAKQIPHVDSLCGNRRQNHKQRE